jgi:C-terminal processing protease CtpA/Prc
MKLKTTNFIVTILIVTLSGCSIYREDIPYRNHKIIKNEELYKKIPVNKLHEDMDYFLKIMEDVHVHPYLITSKDVFYKEFKKTKAEITGPLTRKEFYQKLTPLVHLIKASHTSVNFPHELFNDYKNSGGKFFPTDLEIDYDKKVFLKQDYSNKSLNPGTEIVSINGIKAVDMVNRLLRYEKGSAERANIKRAQGRIREFLWQVYDFEGSFQIETINKKVIVDGKTWDEIEEAKNKGNNKENSTDWKSLKYTTLNPETGLLTIKQFWVWKVPEFNDTIRKCFQQIQTDNISNLIIDVRGNQGGDDRCGEELCQYISDKPYRLYSLFLRKKSRRYNRDFRKGMFRPWTWWFLNIRTATWFSDEAKQYFGSYVKNTPMGGVDTIRIPLIQPREEPLRFRGNTYVLMDEYCYSGTLGFLAPVKDFNIAPIIGTESGESPSGYGEAYQFDLPNSHLYCRISVTMMIRPNGDPDVTRGIMPDYEVSQSIADTQRNEDTVLNFTLNLIEEKK